jgi:AbrB family looped-hinge helix DNA binding protein
MDVAARVTSKGQITIPRAVREALGLGEGDHVVFRVEGGRALLARTRPGGPVPQRAMTAVVDTNVLIRHLTGDPPGQAVRPPACCRGPASSCCPI